MEKLERKTDGIVLNYKEVVYATLQSDDSSRFSSFLGTNYNRSSTVELPVQDNQEFYINPNEINF